MIGHEQRLSFLAVGAVCFLTGLLLLILGLLNNTFALKVIGPCFMLSGVTWTAVVLLALKLVKIHSVEPVAALVTEQVREEEHGGGRVRLSESGFVDPIHCFCQIPDDEMRPWVEKRYLDHVSTMELLKSTNDPHQKEVISIVSMFDVDEDTLLGVMGGVDMPDHHIIHCRENVRRMLGVE
ncbi:MAG: hypothetical protein HN919_11115 [Verrucomicrobia bacterium]|jgi:hypothetical protein|nr:hypothetical protein [Verrucomicrobiota bacterium]MBT7066844.1 hypothetical protein [Verrucomicrobiota bacterium]MBT7700515.1 hypothetical protein [Verrucomicrobiota bacterium]